MPKVKLIAPDGGDRIVPGLGGIVVKAGETVDVSAEVAGEGPRWRQVGDESDPLHLAHDHGEFFARREHAGKAEVYDLGSGLLAQTDIWESVKTVEKKGE